MPVDLSQLFWPCVALVAVGQMMILRSTVRALRATPPDRRGTEWAYAIVPALALVLVLGATWRATHTREIRVPVTGEVRS